MKSAKIFLLALLFSTPLCAASTTALLQQLSAIEDGQKALALANQLQPGVSAWPILDQGRFYIRLGLIQEDKLHEINDAGTSFNHAVALLETLPQPTQALADAYYERAYIKYIKTYDTKIYCPDREKAVSLTRQMNHPEVLVKYLTSLAFCYTDSPQHFQRGLELLDEAMTLAEKQGLNADQRGMIYNATALLYRKNQYYNKAYEYSQLAYDQWASLGDRQGMENMQHTLLVNAIDMGNLAQAEEHGKQLFTLADTSPDFSDFRFFADYDNGAVAFARKEWLPAIKLFQQAKAEEKNTSEAMFIALNRAQLAIAYFMNGNMQTALQEAAAVTKMPGYASLEAGKQQAVQALLQFQQHSPAKAMHTLFNLVADEQDQRRQFVQNTNRDYEIRHDNRLQQFEKQLLENQLKIQQLQLSAQQRQQQTSRWYLLLTGATAISLALLAYTLLRSRRRFRKQAQTDALTGIANRRHFFDFTHKLVKRTRQPEQPVSVLVLDIDHFKSINDTYGHQAGDAAIKHVAAHALTCVRANDLLGRTGGEEFAAILPDADADEAWKIAERIRICIEHTPLNYGGDQVHITISVGVATGKLAIDDAETLLQTADHAMYCAKSAGRNRCHQATITTRNTEFDTAVVAAQFSATVQN
ncbi:MAG: GGDEF domain-containing protein [Steroidobacter sp.]